MRQTDTCEVFTREEKSAIHEKFQALISNYLKGPHRRRVERIEKAFRLADDAHRGMRRRSGEPYIMHPLAVAEIVSRELSLGSTSICAALLHDVPEHTDFNLDDIRVQLGDKIADIVGGVTRISGGFLGMGPDGEAGNLREMLISMNTDIRVIIVKMAERLHNMRTLHWVLPEKRLKVARETMYLYSPLAERLGLFKFKQEFEELAFRFMYPEEYDDIQARLQIGEAERRRVVSEFLAPVIPKLDEARIRYEIKTRVKSSFSIFNKMKKKQIPFEEIYDIFAIRVIFENDDDSRERMLCWQIYTIFTDFYASHPDRLRDWTSVPKSNGYRALHLTCMSQCGRWIEVQIRSRKMDDIAELGLAAHWKYKSGDSSCAPELDNWVNTIRDILANPNSDSLDFLDSIKLNIYCHEIFIFTRGGNLVRLPSGSTVADLARKLEPDRKCIAGRVNHKLVTPDHILNSGDQVDLVTVNNESLK